MELLPRRVNKLLRESNINPLLPTIGTFHTSLMHFAGKLENFNLGNSAATVFILPTILNQQKCIVDNRNALLITEMHCYHQLTLSTLILCITQNLIIPVTVVQAPQEVITSFCLPFTRMNRINSELLLFGVL